MRQPELAITLMAAVPVVPASYGRGPMQNPFDVSHEMRMAKSAMLYADQVSLASWRVSLMKTWEQIRDARVRGDARKVVDLFVLADWVRGGRGVISSNAHLEALVDELGDGLTVERAEKEIGPFLDAGLLSLETAYRSESWIELNEAIDIGALEIQRMGVETGFGFAREAAIAEYLELIREHTTPHTPRIPMLDYSAAGVFEVGTRVGILEAPLPRSAKEVSLAAHYMGYVPAVGKADLASVLKARNELRRPLIRFRALMAELAEEVEASPAAPDFANSADELFRRELAPQLEEIRDQSRERGFRQLLAEEVVESKAGALTKAVIGIAAAGVAGLPIVAQAAVAASVLGTEVASGVIRRRREAHASRAENSLFWMYDLEPQLDEHVHQRLPGIRAWNGPGERAAEPESRSPMPAL